MVEFYGVRRSSFSLVLDARRASRDWGNRPVRLVLPSIPDVPGKLLSLFGRAHSGGAWTRRSRHGSVSLCATPDVSGDLRFSRGDVSLTWLLVWMSLRIDFYDHPGKAGGVGGTDVTRRAARLHSVYRS